MEISLNAQVNFADSPCGCITHVVINLVSQQVTHLVVSVRGEYPCERLVPIRWVVGTTPNSIQMCCTGDYLDRLAPFTEVAWSEFGPCHSAPLLDQYLIHKLLMRPHFNVVKRKQISSDELAIRRGTQVRTANGHAGRVEKLFVDPVDWRITQLVLRTGRVWNPSLVTIPFSLIDCIGDDAGLLKLDRRGVTALPVSPGS